ncbi:hypothetical protein D3C75_948890 [compost metagenome]
MQKLVRGIIGVVFYFGCTLNCFRLLQTISCCIISILYRSAVHFLHLNQLVQGIVGIILNVCGFWRIRRTILVTALLLTFLMGDIAHWIVCIL